MNNMFDWLFKRKKEVVYVPVVETEPALRPTSNEVAEQKRQKRLEQIRMRREKQLLNQQLIAKKLLDRLNDPRWAAKHAYYRERLTELEARMRPTE